MIRFKNSSLWGYLYIAPLFVVIAIYLVFPFVYNLATSFYEWGGIGPDRTFVGLANYSKLLRDPIFVTILRNFVVFGFFTITLQAFFGLVLAVLLKDFFVGRDLLKSVIFMPAVVSAVVIGNVFFRILEPNFGHLNTFLRSIGLAFLARQWLADPGLALWVTIVVHIWQWTGFSMTLYYAGVKGISNDIYEAVKIDGAGKIKTFAFITVPLVRNVTYSLTILGVISVLKQFDLVYTMTRGGPANATQMFSIYIYRASFQLYRVGYASAIAMVLFLVAMGITIVQLGMYRGRQSEL